MPASRVWLAVIALFALFLGGGGIGLWLADALAPGSRAAQFVSFFALPLAFAVGLQIWYGLALLSVVPRLLGFGRSPPEVRPSRGARAELPGSVVFVPVTSGIAAMAGIVVGLLSPTRAAWLVALVYGLVGTAHGLVAWRLARRGVLLPPESV
jgi:hypothetical protein